MMGARRCRASEHEKVTKTEHASGFVKKHTRTHTRAQTHLRHADRQVDAGDPLHRLAQQPLAGVLADLVACLCLFSWWRWWWWWCCGWLGRTRCWLCCVFDDRPPPPLRSAAPRVRASARVLDRAPLLRSARRHCARAHPCDRDNGRVAVVYAVVVTQRPRE